MAEDSCWLCWSISGKNAPHTCWCTFECPYHLICNLSSDNWKVAKQFCYTLGLPEIMVTDNGPAFTSMEFAQFMQRNRIWHVTTAPYHPASNGLAEWDVQTVKEGLRKMVDGSLETRVFRFLFRYWISPHSTSGNLDSQTTKPLWAWSSLNHE